MNPRKFSLVALLFIVAGCVGRPPAETKSVYDEHADARRDLAAAVSQAGASKKNIVLVFGANWCPDCRALDAHMHKPELAAIIERGFVIVKVDVGRQDKNLDLANQFHVPIDHGIPALAVLDPGGNLLYAMDQGQFADARHMSYDSIKEFFKNWSPMA